MGDLPLARKNTFFFRDSETCPKKDQKGKRPFPVFRKFLFCQVSREWLVSHFFSVYMPPFKGLFSLWTMSFSGYALTNTVSQGHKSFSYYFLVVGSLNTHTHTWKSGRDGREIYFLSLGLRWTWSLYRDGLENGHSRRNIHKRTPRFFILYNSPPLERSTRIEREIIDRGSHWRQSAHTRPGHSGLVRHGCPFYVLHLIYRSLVLKKKKKKTQSLSDWI